MICISNTMRRWTGIITIIFLLAILLDKYYSPHFLFNIKEILEGQCTQHCDDNTLLIDHIKTAFVPPIRPSNYSPVLNAPAETQKGQTGQVDSVLKHFNNKRSGFFIEAGAWDGEHLSNTVYLETQLGWTGLLVEPNKHIFETLVTRKRNAFSINCCLAIHGYAEMVIFDTADVFGAIANEEAEQEADKYEDQFIRKDLPRQKEPVQCFPLYSLLLALGNPRVDFFSLDIEGSEIDVLRTVPFDKVDIEMILIETARSNSTAIDELMIASGYEVTPLPPYDTIYIKKYKHKI